ncbi:MAG: HNH endonuclease [Streptosporangiales bacterium]|nr:HNH endonuclease [Streptosporangiales bacterium]
MRNDGTEGPGGYAEALAWVASGLDFLGAAAVGGDLDEPVLSDVLLGLEAAGARLAAVRGSVLARFDAADRHDADGYLNSSSWLRERAGMTHQAAKRQVRQSRVLRSRPRLAAAMRDGTLSESWLDKLTAMTRPVPDDLLEYADEMILKVLAAGGDLDDAAQVIAKILECAAPSPGPGDPDGSGPGDEDGFEDRSLRLETTLGGAGVLRANLTPEAAAAIQAVIDALGKKNGAEDTRSKSQRNHDALHDAAARLLGARLLPDRAGSTTRAEVRIDFADLMGLPGAETLAEAWLTGQLSEPGRLTGKDAEVAACGALISPIVTATPDWDVAAEMICLIAGALRQHEAAAPAGTGDADDRPPVPLPPEAWQALLYAVGKLAIKFVSGPGAIASLLRTGLLSDPFTGKSVALDIGFSNHIPDSIRRAVIARAGGRCEWPGGCDVPAAACHVHHVKHRKDGGPTSAGQCILACTFHHEVAIHRWGCCAMWRTAISPAQRAEMRGEYLWA